MSPSAGKLLVEEIIPRIRVSVLAGSTIIVGADDHEELIQDATATAATLLISTEARGKKVTPGNIAFYAVGLVRQGRRSGGQSKTDVMSPGTQIAGRCRVESLDQPIAAEAEGDEMCLHDVLAGRSADPSQEAARRLDWRPLVDSLDATAKEVLLCLIEGTELTTLVSKLKRSRSALQNDKERLARLAIEHLGVDILTVVQRLPQWRDNLVATREKPPAVTSGRRRRNQKEVMPQGWLSF